jgi:3-polyprenyl-4-hydroxybenzoate decarboxylase
MHSTETLKNLLSSGAGLRIDAKAISLNSLNELAAIAHSSNTQLTIYNASHILKDSIERLAVVGERNISFEF